jgi:hypothetical protein
MNAPLDDVGVELDAAIVEDADEPVLRLLRVSREVIGWQACCVDFVMPVRSKPACLSSKVPVPVPRTPSTGSAARIAKALARMDETIRRRATKRRCRRPCTRRSHHGRNPAPSPNVSCAFAVSTQPCLVAWHYGARPRANDLDPRGDATAAASSAAAISPLGRALHLGSGKVGPG